MGSPIFLLPWPFTQFYLHPQADQHKHSTSFQPNAPPAPGYDPYASQTYPAGGPPYSGSGGLAGPFSAGAARNSSHFLLSFLLVAALWMVWTCLYPLTAVAGIAAALLSAPLFMRFFPPDPLFTIHPLPLLLTIVATYAAILGMSRIESRLAGDPIFRIARHVVRLVLFAALTIPLIQLAAGLPTPHPILYILNVVGNPRNIALVLRGPQNVVVVLAVIVGMHFVLWKAGSLRSFWHRRLSAIGLK